MGQPALGQRRTLTGLLLARTSQLPPPPAVLPVSPQGGLDTRGVVFWCLVWGLVPRGGLKGWPRPPQPVQGRPGRSSGTYRGHPIVALVGDEVGEEAPAQGGLLDVVGQDFSRLVWAGEKTREETGAPRHEAPQYSRAKWSFPGSMSRVSLTTWVPDHRWKVRPCPHARGQTA